ncbi:hypothetical protein PGB90_009320 [Kerria lacca]
MDNEKKFQECRDTENGTKERDLQHATSDIGALLHIVKSSLGAGVLAMPFAFKNAGLLIGVIGSIFIGITVTHCTTLLVDSTQKLRKIFNRTNMTYADTVECAFIHGYKGKLKHHAFKARYMVNFFLFFTYYGVLIYYVLIISSTFKQITEEYFKISIDIRIYIAFLTLVLYPTSIIRFLKYLVPFSAVANICLMVALGMIFLQLFKDLPPLNSRPALQMPNQWPLFIATCFTSMEGIGTILPLENEMKNPLHLIHSSRLLYIGMVFSVFVNLFVGFFGYLKYGNDVAGVISLNLPEDWISECVKATVGLTVLLTYGLQMAAPMEVVWGELSKTKKKQNNLHYYILRSILIIGTIIIAILMPSIAGIIGVIGSLGFSMLGIFIPALIDLIYHSDDQSILRQIKNVCLLLFALFCAIVGFYYSVIQLIQDI